MPALTWRGAQGLAVEVLDADGHVAVAHERRPPAEHLVEHDPEGVDVGAAVDRPAVDLLGRQVLGGADDRAGAGEVLGMGGVAGDRLGRGLGDAEVGHLHPPVLAQQDVGRLHVAVDDAGLVGVLEGPRHLGGDVDRLGRRQRPPLEERLPQGGAVDQLHDDEGQPVVEAGVEDADHVGVGQPGGGDGLAPEPLEERRVGGQLGQQQLHRHRPAQHRVLRLPHLGHAAAGDLVAEAVTAGDQVVGGNHHWRGGGGS